MGVEGVLGAVPERDGVAFDRGRVAGEIAQRLTAHDAAFEKLTDAAADAASELRQVTTAMQGLRMAVQQLRDENVARDVRVAATAMALKEADAARRDKSQDHWSPVAKIYATIGTLAGVVGLYLALVRRH